MDLNISDIVALGGMFGSVLGLKELVLWLLNRRSNLRKADAEADEKEVAAAHRVIDILTSQLETLLQRNDSMSAKIDELFRRLRDEELNTITVVKEKHEVEMHAKDYEIEMKNMELRLKDAEYNRCDREDKECGYLRLPPRRNKKLTKIKENDTRLQEQQSGEHPEEQ